MLLTPVWKCLQIIDDKLLHVHLTCWLQKPQHSSVLQVCVEERFLKIHLLATWGQHNINIDTTL